MTNPMISWKHDLSNPSSPGTYPVKAYGLVTVTQDDIDQANKFNGDVNAEIVDTTTLGARMRTFIIGMFTPA